ncbi:MAG: hypothetical protein M0R46_14800 [Candidatus Muirbacterium halophilum]|nr:hypothetical protein [Candidatus Muirbacterium halophilum]
MKNNPLKFFYICLISILPISSKFRTFLYKLIPNYKLGKNNRIGFLSFIFAEKLKIYENVNIYSFCLIKSNFCVFKSGVILKKFVQIKNVDYLFVGNDSVLNQFVNVFGPNCLAKISKNKLYIGKNVGINNCIMDLVDNIYIGDNVVFAGRGIQLWTHTFDLGRNRLQGKIRIKDNCYIGSRSIINLGVKICSNVVLKSGAIVNNNIIKEGVYGFKDIEKTGEIRKFEDLRFKMLSKIDNKKIFKKL